jgi:hypothetical protein
MNKLTYVWLKDFIPFALVLIVGLRLAYWIFIEISEVASLITSYIFIGIFIIGVLGVSIDLFKIFLKNRRNALHVKGEGK